MSPSESEPRADATGAALDDDVSDAAEDDAEASKEADAGGGDTGGAELAAQLEAVTAERDDYVDQLQRQRAEFQNYRKRVESERRQQVAAGVSRLAESLLPVLDGCDAATAQGHSEVDAVGQALMVALGKAGLERIDAVGEEFDPTQHEAVIFEQAPADNEAAHGDDGTRARNAADDALDDEADPADLPAVPSDDAPALSAEDDEPSRQIVVEELRSGYRFDGRVLRAAMVKVRTG